MAVLAVVVDPNDRAVRQLDAARALHLQEEHVDRIGQIEQLEALALQRAAFDLGAGREWDEAGGVLRVRASSGRRPCRAASRRRRSRGPPGGDRSAPGSGPRVGASPRAAARSSRSASPAAPLWLTRCGWKCRSKNVRACTRVSFSGSFMAASQAASSSGGVADASRLVAGLGRRHQTGAGELKALERSQMIVTIPTRQVGEGDAGEGNGACGDGGHVLGGHALGGHILGARLTPVRLGRAKRARLRPWPAAPVGARQPATPAAPRVPPTATARRRAIGLASAFAATQASPVNTFSSQRRKPQISSAPGWQRASSSDRGTPHRGRTSRCRSPL